MQVIVNEENAHDTAEFITKRLNAIKSQRSSGELEDLALVIGQSLCGLSLVKLADNMRSQTGRA